ncbi:MAG: BamA/TamA family outer membrane protein [Bacteroidetes bacterium]|nr:BamA/TamA family outer membrane protein [Bacteroidota bacterium]
MIKYFITILFFSLIPIHVFSQTGDTTYFNGNYSIKVDSIKIDGIKITDPDVILRELTFGIGDTVTSKIVNYNLNRIYSLGIFTHVNMIPFSYKEKNILLISVEESWYIYPIPFVEFQDRDWQKISYGLNLMIRNFRGENETLRATASFGYDPKFIIYYDRPYFIKKQSIYLTLELAYQNSKNKSYTAQNIFGGDFNQKFITGTIDLGKRFNLFNRFDIFFGYNYIESPIFIKGISASDNRIDRQILFGASYTFDTRDLFQFPSTGTYFYIDFQFKGLGMENINYQVADLDLRKYFLLSDDLRLKWRFSTRLTFGKLVPYYDYSYFGYQERIRGYFTTEMEGNDLYFSSLEMNYPIIKDINIDFDFLPIIPKSLLSYRFAVYLELFMDTGTTRLWGQPLSIKNLYSGYGTGLVFLILPYSELRTEFAINDYGKTQFILGLGLSF